MNVTNPVRAQITRRFRASAEDVFDAWLNPTLAHQWFAPGLGEMTRVEIDPRVGGTFWLVQRRGAEEAQHTGEYLEIDRPRRLVFTWRTPPLTERSRVIVEIAAKGEGCVLTLTHEMDQKWAAFVDGATGAWEKMVEAIATLVEGERPGTK